MNRPAPADLERSLSGLLQRLGTVPHLDAEMARARREFFGADRPAYAGDESALASALVRFGEWYALERESEVMGEVPVDGMRRRGVPAEDTDILRDSMVGVFLVERVESRSAQLRDLQDQQILDLNLDRDALKPGDLLAGRLYQGPDGQHIPSPVLGIHSGGVELGSAFQRDILRMGLGRRLSQAELEHLLFRQWGEAPLHSEAPEPLERLEAQLESLLPQDGGEGGALPGATEISDALREAPHPGPVMGPIMDQVAFDTQIDLEAVRRVLMQIWNGHRASSAPVKTDAVRSEFPTGRAESLGQSLARRIEEGLSRHEDVEDLFAAVGEMLGEDLEEDEEPEQPSAYGDLEPLVREFLWEIGTGTRSRAPDQPSNESSIPGASMAGATTVLNRLIALQREAPLPKTDLEYLESFDLLRLLLHIYLESRPVDRAAAVRSAHAVLEQFYSWAQRTQEYELGGALSGCGAMMGDVQRIADLSLALSGPGAGPAPCLMRITEVHQKLESQESAVGLALHGEGVPVLVEVPERAAAELRIGDILLGSLQAGESGTGTLAGMVVVVPGDLEQLLG